MKEERLPGFIEVEKKFFIGHVDGAFDLSSGGIGVHLHAVENFVIRGHDIKDFEETSLSIPGSNFFYFFDDRRRAEIPNEVLSPLILQHLALRKKTYWEYDQLQRLEIVLILTGKEPSEEDFRAQRQPLSTKEVLPLLEAAKLLGLLDFSEENLLLDKIERTTSVGPLISDLMHAGIKLDDSFFERVLKVGGVNFFCEHKQHFLKPALYKLGEMLAGVEELTAEANTLGIPLFPNYRPEYDKKWMDNWQKMFNEPMPTIKELYEQAFAVFSKYVDKNDPFLAYLFTDEVKPKWQK